MIDSFSIFRITDKQADHLPDYRINAKIGEEYREIGAGWVKSGKTGKYISVKLSKPYKGKQGYTIVPVADEERYGNSLERPKHPQNEDFGVEINSDDVDF